MRKYQQKMLLPLKQPDVVASEFWEETGGGKKNYQLRTHTKR